MKSSFMMDWILQSIGESDAYAVFSFVQLKLGRIHKHNVKGKIDEAAFYFEMNYMSTNREISWQLVLYIQWLKWIILWGKVVLISETEKQNANYSTKVNVIN